MSIICNISSFNDREYVLCISISQLSGSVSNTLSRALEISIYILCLYVFFICIVVVQLPSCIRPFVTQIHVHWISDAIQPSHPLLPSSSAFKIFSSIRDFSNEVAIPIRWPKYWSFSFKSLALCLLYGPALTKVCLCDHWEDHSLDYMDLCQQSSVCFSTHYLHLS